MRTVFIAILSGLLAGPGIAQEPTPPRCALLGQMAVSSWLDLVATLPRQDAATIDPALARLADLTGSYSNLGCDPARLGAAMDCLLDRSGSAAPHDLARACMGEAGLNVGG